MLWQRIMSRFHVIVPMLALVLFVACEKDDKKVVVCWGDSLTAPHGNESAIKGFVKNSLGRNMSYPFRLQSLLGDDYNVRNAGEGGENTLTIMARQGAYPMRLAHDVTVFKSDKTDGECGIGNTDVPAFISSYNGQVVKPLLRAEYLKLIRA